MRAYHFLSAKYALDDVRKRRLKISELDQLNDPFELWCVAQEDRATRELWRSWRQDFAQRYGMLCFSAGWHNPVLWSHYADRHQGMCLGFDVDDALMRPVDYIAERLPAPQSVGAVAESYMKHLLYTKYKDWSYEQEWRCWVNLESRDGDAHYFADFGDSLQLKEVITGPLCRVQLSQIVDAVGHEFRNVSYIKGRLAFRSFQIVGDRRGFPVDANKKSAVDGGQIRSPKRPNH